MLRHLEISDYQPAVSQELNLPESDRSAARKSECAGQLAADRQSSIWSAAYVLRRSS
eukprot:SAG25_NODE_1259_length_3474_cov_6.612741_7_plen_57_part_00